jgi:hypothetical protein
MSIAILLGGQGASPGCMTTRKYHIPGDMGGQDWFDRNIWVLESKELPEVLVTMLQRINE